MLQESAFSENCFKSDGQNAPSQTDYAKETDKRPWRLGRNKSSAMSEVQVDDHDGEDEGESY
jgi:hypothetical protein